MNVLSTFLLARLVIPKLQETAAQGHATPRLSIVSSALHKFASLGAVKSPSILAALDERTEDYDARYQDSKLLLHLYGAKLAAELSTPGKPSICFNLVNPGYCVSQLKPPTSFATRMAENVMARSTDEGARTLVDAVAADKAAGRHGMYIDDMKVKRYVTRLHSAPFLHTNIFGPALLHGLTRAKGRRQRSVCGARSMPFSTPWRPAWPRRSF